MGSRETESGYHKFARLLTSLLLPPCLVMALGGTAIAAEKDKLYYRYENAEGITVIDDHVPPQFAYKGYSVLNAQGRVVEVVPRALTAAERRDVNSSAVQQRLRAEQSARQQRYDELLLSRYSSVSDVEAARERKVNAIKVRINGLKGSIEGLKKELESQQQQAAELERESQQVPEDLLRAIEGLRAEIAAAEQQIERYESERSNTETRFEYDAQRLRELRPDVPRPE